MSGFKFVSELPYPKNFWFGIAQIVLGVISMCVALHTSEDFNLYLYTPMIFILLLISGAVSSVLVLELTNSVQKHWTLYVCIAIGLMFSLPASYFGYRWYSESALDPSVLKKECLAANLLFLLDGLFLSVAMNALPFWLWKGNR